MQKLFTLVAAGFFTFFLFSPATLAVQPGFCTAEPTNYFCGAFLNQPDCSGSHPANCSWTGSECVAGGTNWPCSQYDSNNCPSIPTCSWAFQTPNFTWDQSTSMLSSLGVAFTGILGFFVDTSTIWLILAAAWLLVFAIKKYLNLGMGGINTMKSISRREPIRNSDLIKKFKKV